MLCFDVYHTLTLFISQFPEVKVGYLPVLHTRPPARPLRRPEAEGDPVARDLVAARVSPRGPARAGDRVEGGHDGLDVEHQLPPLPRLQPEPELLAGPLLGAAVQRHGAALVLVPAVQQRGHVNRPEIVLYWSGVNRNLNNKRQGVVQ